MADYNEMIAEPQNPLPIARLSDLPESLLQAAGRAGWAELMPVQARAMPYLFAGREVLVQARTGSGKTGAYLLPMLERLNPIDHAAQALVLVPTRELAHQVETEAQVLCAPAGLKSVAVYGGVGYGPQNQALREGAQIVIGTPGRLLDHLMRRTLNLEKCRMLIYDEADRMLGMGFYQDMRAIRSYVDVDAVQSFMFSATFPLSVLRSAREFMRKPEYISLSTDHVHVTEVQHQVAFVSALDKDRALVRLIEAENPASAIIFCNTKQKVHYVNVVLQRFGYDAAELSADLSQQERETVLERVRKGRLKFLVATDVAARGLDIPEISHVIQYEVPDETEAYIHRAGRTGRAGAGGTAILLVSPAEKSLLTRIRAQYDISFEEISIPNDTEVQSIVGERLAGLLEARLRERDKLEEERSRRFEGLAETLAGSEEGRQLIAMLLDDTYQSALHARPVLPDEEPRSKPGPSRRSEGRRRARRGGPRTRLRGTTQSMES